MNVEEIRNYCISKNGVEESFPFDSETLVFKIGGKIFLLMGIHSNPIQFNVKCEPQKAIDLREKYSFVLPGYHMNKAHWNTIVCDGRATKKLVFDWIDDSYSLIIQSLPKKQRDVLLK
ncbi:MmcQ/YjbR family DNA-binding protein [Sediminibacterium sp.]|uniref:MmcQ/YjbR family DNA-binding protein n=1 Tax=Sediminibacterium sp. TaxID=1917865 RepID=UPI0027250D98|nr:MmcQ/YjbR family DNA-binding protein [Sediminibacterium sp.]MDO9000484.1 MmcQ/YjbR family DNA-binding protein [Bacteroidota bacterium]MDP3146948.1 MmcQ/YjbR family DNA-binding protein [Bacteroidota bacterium]MDP3567514.1 MmcQ/YjbR family DNA-binding protein [Sediminibacterium sp.]